MRIAFGRIAQETHSLSPIKTTLDDFRRTHFFEGAELLARCARHRIEAPGFLRNAELSGFVRAARAEQSNVELVPLFSAWAVPGGPLDQATWSYLRDRLLEELACAGPLNGVFLTLHGALCADGQTDAEGSLLRDVRELVGPDVPIAITLDLHAQLTPAMVDNTTIIAAYRTNPHRDHTRVGRRAGRMLLDAAAGRTRPVMAWRSLPMAIGGGRTIDFLSPMRAIFGRMKRMDREPRALYSNLLMCQLWTDAEALGWSTCVVTDGDQALAETLADELAEKAWSVRNDSPPTFPSADEALAIIRDARLARATGTVCVCDASDVVGAGATGENTRLLKALLEDGGDLLSFVPLRDAQVVDALWHEAADANVTVTVGGKLDPVRCPPLTVSGRLVRRERTESFGRVVLLDLGCVQLVLTEGPPLAMKPAFYQDVGLRPMRADVVVVKSFFPFRLFFLPQSRKTLYVKTLGITDIDAVWELEPAGPIYPRDAIADWRPTDRSRRGVAIA